MHDRPTEVRVRSYDDVVKLKANGLPIRTPVRFVCERCHEESVKQLRSTKDLVCEGCKSRAFHASSAGKARRDRAAATNASRSDESKTKTYEKFLATREKNGGKEAHAERVREGFRRKYGVDNVFQTEFAKEKSKKTKLEKYGDENYNDRTSARETCLRRYGVDHPCKSSKTIEKTKATKLERYGDPNYNDREKASRTCVSRYGVPHHCQDPETYKRVAWGKVEYDGERFDSSWEVAFWVCRKLEGKSISRNHAALVLDDGKKCYPDFVVEGRLVEVKGDHLKGLPGWKLKEKCYKENDVEVLSFEDLKEDFAKAASTMRVAGLKLPRGF